MSLAVNGQPPLSCKPFVTHCTQIWPWLVIILMFLDIDNISSRHFLHKTSTYSINYNNSRIPVSAQLSITGTSDVHLCLTTVWYGIVESNVPLDTVGHFGDGMPYNVCHYYYTQHHRTWM